MKRPKTVEGYVELVKQALFEVEDLLAAYEYDSEGLGNVSSFLGELAAHVKNLHQKMVDGTYQFATGELPYMHIVRAQGDNVLPFKSLLMIINETHEKGLDVDPT